jgi:hypothetical protein
MKNFFKVTRSFRKSGDEKSFHLKNEKVVELEVTY